VTEYSLDMTVQI